MIITAVIVLIELVTSNNIYLFYVLMTFDSDTIAPAVTQMRLQVAADDKRIWVFHGFGSLNWFRCCWCRSCCLKLTG